MFLIYLSERIGILESHDIKVKVFADDVKLSVRITDDVDFFKLQNALDSLKSWADMWKLCISIDKIMLFSEHW